MNCFASFVNFIMYLLNIVFLVVGILLIVLGSIMLSNISQFDGFSQLMSTNTIPIMITILGVLIFVVSFFGCCGAWRQSACLTGTYAIFMLILFILQLTLTIWIFVNRAAFLQDMSKLVNTAWSENTSAQGYPIEAFELAFNCCGNSGYEDYYYGTVPGTCCGYTDRTKTCPASIYMTREGCNQNFVNFWESNTDIMRWAGIGICIFELFVFVVASCLTRSMRRSGGHSI
ncbi:23 kDa integral membrane protein-like [Scaptodrosophila lebanonensis]|uniref:Tetraspanin n=1 Tax=Drosophila lebanonensis TaxID=7225 RepID=A0A6J2UGD2_DROLE|nr:23 kDa integral membrane protein-like [Scaptodrosophila lebanonensis]